MWQVESEDLLFLKIKTMMRVFSKFLQNVLLVVILLEL